MSLSIEGSLDTNIVLRWILGDVTGQTEITDKLLNSGKNLRVSQLVIAEVVYILEAKGFSRNEIYQTTTRVLAQRDLYIERSIISPALDMYLEHPGVSFVDACLVFDAQENSAVPLYTFDRKLANKSKNCVIPS